MFSLQPAHFRPCIVQWLTRASVCKVIIILGLFASAVWWLADPEQRVQQVEQEGPAEMDHTGGIEGRSLATFNGGGGGDN